MNTANWSVQQAIKERVDIEDRYTWATKQEKIELPKYQKPPKVTLTAGVWNFIREVLKELKP